ncbi:hypothetical protein EX30DRAFT_166891 [Ascodesmis nigricans]|uniref:Phosphoglycerate mutase-like protein n=1 Tax=Ascodesmis nigricans TaxID=341454 RepID=A0A4V3SHZ5_9PEZI|nr:hypothetical protein EX30DRAFT_166891 [Ascodesmis nigricans]
MPKPTQVYILRHGARLDMASPQWIYTTPTPYDPPLTTSGKLQSAATGARIATLLPGASTITETAPDTTSELRSTARPSTSTSISIKSSSSSDVESTLSALSLTDVNPSRSSSRSSLSNTSDASEASEASETAPKPPRIILHVSPFLRCLQTATHLSTSLPTKPLLRLSAWVGEWMTPDYYTDITPPPPIATLISNAKAAFAAREIDNSDAVVVDYAWNGGTGAELGEEWSSMHKRFREGLEDMIRYYDNEEVKEEDEGREAVVILVTHGAGCNALLGAISKRPVLMDVGIGAMSLATLGQTSKEYELDIVSSTTPTPTNSNPSSTTASHPHHHHKPHNNLQHGYTYHPHHSHHLSIPTSPKHHRSSSSSIPTYTPTPGLWSPHNNNATALPTPTLVITGGAKSLGLCEREKERELEREKVERESDLGFGGWGVDVGMEKEDEDRKGVKEEVEKGGLWKAKGWEGVKVKRRWTVGKDSVGGGDG